MPQEKNSITSIRQQLNTLGETIQHAKKTAEKVAEIMKQPLDEDEGTDTEDSANSKSSSP